MRLRPPRKPPATADDKPWRAERDDATPGDPGSATASDRGAKPSQSNENVAGDRVPGAPPRGRPDLRQPECAYTVRMGISTETSVDTDRSAGGSPGVGGPDAAGHRTTANAEEAAAPSPPKPTEPTATAITLDPEKQAKVDRYRELNRTIEPGGIVCAGSSLMEFFPIERMAAEAGLDLNLHNRGVAGFVADELLACLDECVLALRPARLVINIGTNDLNDPATTNDVLVARYERILTAIERELPGIDITMPAYYPVNPDVATDEGVRRCLAVRTNARIRAANEAVRGLAGRHHARFVDLNAPLLDGHGRLRAEYTVEGMHLNEAGYRAILPAFLDLLNG